MPHWGLLLVVLCPVSVQAFEISLEPPGPRAFVRDEAGLLNAADRAAVVDTCVALLNDQWGIGHETIEGQPWNKGVLLLIARDDRKARIELGAGYAHDYDVTCTRIMDGLIIPQFKAGNFSAGIRAGVEGLDRMVRGKTLPITQHTAAQSVSRAANSGCGAGSKIGQIFMWIAALFAGSRMRSGGGGRGGGGSFSGGSFGGGYSGGGGASGSW